MCELLECMAVAQGSLSQWSFKWKVDTCSVIKDYINVINKSFFDNNITYSILFNSNLNMQLRLSSCDHSPIAYTRYILFCHWATVHVFSFDHWAVVFQDNWQLSCRQLSVPSHPELLIMIPPLKTKNTKSWQLCSGNSTWSSLNSDNQVSSPCTASPSSGNAIHFTLPQFTQLYEWLPGSRLWWTSVIKLSFYSNCVNIK